MDQAEQLRLLRNEKCGLPNPLPLRRITAITGGKGGVGKSNVALNLTLALAELGESVGLMDADFGLANIDVLLGIKPKFNVGHVLSGQKNFSEIVMDAPGNIKLVPAASGFKNMAKLSEETLSFIAEQIRFLGHSFDHLIIDTAAGISSDVMTFLKISDEIIVIATPEPTSVTDSYALIKAFKIDGGRGHIKILLNMCQSEEDGLRIGERLRQICTHFLGLETELLGILLRDDLVVRSIRYQKAFLLAEPECSASKQIRKIALQLKSDHFEHRIRDDFFDSVKGALT
jgi:flagellar biosynthesis protein FlhG